MKQVKAPRKQKRLLVHVGVKCALRLAAFCPVSPGGHPQEQRRSLQVREKEAVSPMQQTSKDHLIAQKSINRNWRVDLRKSSIGATVCISADRSQQ